MITMKAQPTRLRVIGFTSKIVAGLGLSVFFVFLAIVIPLWPITAPLFLFLAIGAPFVFLGYRASGVCPHCYEKIEVTKKYGGVQCKGCKKSSSIQGNKMYPI